MATESRLQVMAAMALERVIAVNPVAVTVNGNSVTCGRGGMKEAVKFTDFGEAEKYSFSILGHFEDFKGAEPGVDVVTIDGKEYRVLGKDPDAAEIGISVHLGAKYS